MSREYTLQRAPSTAAINIDYAAELDALFATLQHRAFRGEL